MNFIALSVLQKKRSSPYVSISPQRWNISSTAGCTHEKYISIFLAERLSQSSFIACTPEISAIGTPRTHIPCDGRNTAYKAAQYYFDATGVPFGADIYIEKHIPDQAGMGGGSADAAAVLKLLNHLCAEAGEEPLNTAELLYLGLRIGADVPFCILNGTYRCLGIGEQLLPLAEIPKCYLVVVKPDVGVSTPEAYRACDNVPDGGMRYTPGMVRAVEHRSIEEIANALGNRFDDALQISVVQEIKKYLCENGALNALMTGSGSAVFGIFSEKSLAENAAKHMPQAFGACFLAEPVNG